MGRRTGAGLICLVIILVFSFGRKHSAVIPELEVPWRPSALFRLDDASIPVERLNRAANRFFEIQPRTVGDFCHLSRTRAVSAADAEVSLRPAIQTELLEFIRRSPELVVSSPLGFNVRKSLPGGVTAIESQWPREPHTDQILCTLAEVGVPLAEAVNTKHGTISVSDLLDSARRNYVRGQEPYWSVVAFVSYLPTEESWQNRFGETISYSKIATDLLEKAPDEAPCVGAHRQYALAILLRLDHVRDIMPQATRLDVEAHLRHASDLLQKSQRRNGSWDRDWAKAKSVSTEGFHEAGEIEELVHVTGHHLEWIVLLPDSLRPSDSAIRAAIDFVLDAYQRCTLQTIRQNYCSYSHALRAVFMIH